MLDEDEEPGWVIRKRQNLATSPLCRLPLELLLMIKAYLSPTSVFILCHTSAFFIPLLDKGVLEKKPLVYFGIGDVRKLLQGEYFCRWCLDRLEGAFRRLRMPLYCDGCGLEHPAFLFPLDQRADGEDPKRPRMCFGRIGHIQLCAHKTVSWSDVEKVRDRSGNPTSIACTHRSHLPLRSQWWAGMLPTNLRPRGAFESRGNLPTVKSQTVRQLLAPIPQPHEDYPLVKIAGPLFGYRLCPHVHDDYDKAPFRAPASDTCPCVPGPAATSHDDDNPSHCCLYREFICPVCRGVYTWRREGGRVSLSFTWSRLVSDRPTSRNWLRALAPEYFSAWGRGHWMRICGASMSSAIRISAGRPFWRK
ncbi:hypothetical protein QBC33DRAFT_596730 [Phialemonium atrogriseum]|uniref:F-box domain-containing protein n=1 Tax=Phialemonium atrogriseum TaxID=1093897 RepID=A0AAJ0BT11_9PEZI|nr:uncharacterized protein QBC33DRAFT_596730 [Phialemonium atrogriseum]KAK1763910.1 hypothetical protein QBC33DRAFT_596730 [Phialemonium atrogriseum]